MLTLPFLEETQRGLLREFFETNKRIERFNQRYQASRLAIAIDINMMLLSRSNTWHYEDDSEPVMESVKTC